MARIVVIEVNVLAQIAGKQQAIHGEFGGEKRSGHVVKTIFDLYLQMGIRDERLNQVGLHVGRAWKTAAVAGMFPIPVPADFKIENIVGFVGAEFEFLAKIAVDGGSETAGHGGVGGIGLRVLREPVVGGSRKAGIVAADGESAAALEFGAELSEGDAQIGFDDVVLAQAGEARELFRDVGSFGVAE